jgi:hypothetical protein
MLLSRKWGSLDLPTFKFQPRLDSTLKDSLMRQLKSKTKNSIKKSQQIQKTISNQKKAA